MIKQFLRKLVIERSEGCMNIVLDDNSNVDSSVDEITLPNSREAGHQNIISRDATENEGGIGTTS